ncbi:MAG: hypothetical protein PHC28_04840 [Flavobacterium sp.]|uniref:hypothetical protein n=1 Tax=Flavobacterium sp. TaxID=239 RepID=UPI0026154098|nr:hypothetical protein [Flavobacterium sp.]MDD5149792.1 hypothetical protein [Flavobacterium sp.]
MKLEELVEQWLNIDIAIGELGVEKINIERQIEDIVAIDSLVNFCNTGEFLILEENSYSKRKQL